MKVETERLPKNGIKFKITVDGAKILETKDHVIGEMVKITEVKGFRKGEAPRNIVEANLDPGKVRGELINHLVPEAYDQAVKETHIKPIILPKVELVNFEDLGDLVFTATTCEAPVVSLGDYKSQITNLKSQNTAGKAILGADGQPLTGNKEAEGSEESKIDDVLKVLLENSGVEVCDLLIDEEVNHMLSRLVDQTGRLGITVDQYLTSVGKDAEALKKEYRETAEKTLKLEFALAEVGKNEGVVVEDPEVAATINAAPDEQSKKSLSEPGNRAYIKSILLKNKTIQKLIEYTK